MSTIDRQRIAAVNTLVELGFVFRDGSWHPPLPTTVGPAEAELLASVSHELRTPLNAMLILAQQLAYNADGNLSPKQVEFARTIHSAGRELSKLINDILEMSKIRSGTISVDVEDINVSTLIEEVARPFHDKATARGIAFNVDVDVDGTIGTDAKRLRQALNNLLSNAFNFTSYGGVTLRAFAPSGRGNLNTPHLGISDAITFEVSDSGIDIQPRIIFEAIQQGDGGSIPRKYRGTTLGLAISREWATLLGGEFEMHSTPGSGSTFTLTLPTHYPGLHRQRAGQRVD